VLQSEKVGKEVYFWVDPPRLRTALQRVLQYLEQEM